MRAPLLRKIESFVLRWLGTHFGRAWPGAGTPPDPQRVREVLVVRPHNELGDFILGLPVIQGFCESYPQARITLVGGPKHRELAAAVPCVQRFLVLDKKDFWLFPWRLFSFLSDLGEGPYDVAVCPSTVSVSVTSTLLTAFSGARLTVGRTEADLVSRPELEPFLDILAPRPEAGQHQTEKNFDVLYALDLPPPRSSTPRLVLPEDAGRQAREIFKQESLDQRAPLIFLHVGAGKLRNQWPSRLYAHLADLLEKDLGATMIFVRSPGDEKQVEKVCALTRASKVVLPTMGLLQDAALIADCDLFIGNDTGLLHVASAVGTATIGLYGPTDPAEWAPLSDQHRSLRGEKDEVGLIIPQDVVRQARASLGR